MAKVEVTPVLADSIKMLRIQKGLSSKQVALALDRSPSYFSKIESGNIKSIEKEELDHIFYVVVGDDRDFDEQIDSLYSTLKIKYTADEIDEEIWFRNYDTVKREIPIPPDLIDDINNRISQAEVSVAYLVERINGNDEVPEEYRYDEEYEFNEWQVFGKREENNQFIKMAILQEAIEKILNKEIVSSNYVTMLAIVYYLTKIEEYQDNRNVAHELSNPVMRKAVDYLNNHKFYSLSEKEKLLNLAATHEEQQRILTTFDRENADLINEMLGGFKVFSEMDVAFTNKQLTSFIANLHWDSGLMLKLIGLPFKDLNKTSFKLKQEMLTEIEAVVEKYKNIPEGGKTIERYA